LGQVLSPHRSGMVFFFAVIAVFSDPVLSLWSCEA